MPTSCFHARDTSGGLGPGRMDLAGAVAVCGELKAGESRLRYRRATTTAMKLRHAPLFTPVMIPERSSAEGGMANTGDLLLHVLHANQLVYQREPRRCSSASSRTIAMVRERWNSPTAVKIALASAMGAVWDAPKDTESTEARNTSWHFCASGEM